MGYKNTGVFRRRWDYANRRRLMAFGAAAVGPTTGDADITLPQLTVQGGGAATGSITLPSVTVLSQAHLPADVDITLPQLSLNAQAHLPADIDIILPVLTLESFTGALANITLPSLTLLARGYKGTPPDCVVLNTNNDAVSEYLNYGFNSMTRFNGQFLVADQNGIYEQDASNEDEGGYKIKSAIKTGEINIYNDNIQRLRNAWLSYESDGDIQVVTRADQIITRRYLLPLQDSNGIDERRIKFERGIKDRVFDFKIENVNGSSMDIKSLLILLEPLISKER